MNRIAIVSSDERVRVVSPYVLGVPYLAVSPREHRCAWPVWSPDGGELMYSAYPAAGSNGHGAFRVISRPPGEARDGYLHERAGHGRNSAAYAALPDVVA